MGNSFKITGEIHTMGKTNKVTPKFSKREFVLVIDKDDKFTQYLPFQVNNDKCSLLDDYKVGDTITAHFNMRGREWEKSPGDVKTFLSLEVWRIDAGGEEGEESAPKAKATAKPKAPPSDPWAAAGLD
jgi:hypothetical protein